uniref:NADH dehydrogenase subunit 6 n=1 Tax=Agamermis sp. BH-2006 TaxID=390897 RepID=Q0Z875_9BILA|nr:NADH dehydrogenase subunit 6 [Agamermis sp. BH-2006]ABG38299.1 NADH dehydrogenase subunit 6 [Agamermis sp. BH-2006]
MKIKMLIGTMIFMLLMNHPSYMCMCLAIFCLFLGFFMKSLVPNIFIYSMLIIFIGGILLLLFYLTMINTNKTSWQNMLYLTIFMAPDFYEIHNLKFSCSTIFIEMFNLKTLMIFMMGVLMVMLMIMNTFLLKVSFMRQF